MSAQTQPKLPSGIKWLELSSKLSVRVGARNPRGKYTVVSEGGETLISSIETLTEFEVACDGGKRYNGFYIDLLDGSNQQMISLRRSPSLKIKMQVRMDGVLVATVYKYPSFRKPMLLLHDGISNLPVLRIKGPVAYNAKCDFDLQTLTKQSIGGITKLCGPGVTESVEDYKITFPKDMDVKFKAAVLGTCFLIDFLCFEKSW